MINTFCTINVGDNTIRTILLDHERNTKTYF